MGEIGARESRVVLMSSRGAAMGMGGAGGTAAAATGRDPGGVLWDTARSRRTPIASPSYRHRRRYT